MSIAFPRLTLSRWLALATIAAGTPALASAQTPVAFRLTSPDVAANSQMTLKQVYNGFGCTGQNVSPALAWTMPPAGTMSYAITVYDPDAPTGSGWWHWMVYDIPATTTSIPAGAGNAGKPGLPAGALQGMTDFGTKGWGGPCPPAGDKPHRYVFTVFALKVAKLDVPATATSALIGFNLNAMALGKASFTAKYGR
jgi:Raf kinase inhibitor-like YbhB/YbcL family protein